MKGLYFSGCLHVRSGVLLSPQPSDSYPCPGTALPQTQFSPSRITDPPRGLVQGRWSHLPARPGPGPATRMPGRSSLSRLCHSERASVPGDLGAVLSLSSREASPRSLTCATLTKPSGRSGVWSCCPLGLHGRRHEAPQNLAAGL